VVTPVDVEALLAPSWQAVTFGEPAEAAGVDEQLAARGVHVARLDGAEVLTRETLLVHLGEVFAFPSRVHNFDAANDWLRDLTWLAASGYVLRVDRAERLWQEAPTLAGSLVGTWLFCAEYWRAQQPGSHRHPPVTPFHLLMVW
jgi:hypothetical protein